MNNDTAYLRTMVFGYDIEQCPECGHLWTDDAECHYNDCRYFSLEQEMDAEDSEPEVELP